DVTRTRGIQLPDAEPPEVVPCQALQFVLREPADRHRLREDDRSERHPPAMAGPARLSAHVRVRAVLCVVERVLERESASMQCESRVETGVRTGVVEEIRGAVRLEREEVEVPGTGRRPSALDEFVAYRVGGRPFDLERIPPDSVASRLFAVDEPRTIRV